MLTVSLILTIITILLALYAMLSSNIRNGVVGLALAVIVIGINLFIRAHGIHLPIN